MAHELIRFTLADPHLELLKEQAEKSKEDSIHVYAKKLLIDLLGGQEELLSPSVKESLQSDIQQVRDAIHALNFGEQRLEDNLNEMREAIKAIDLSLEMRDRGLEEVREKFERRLDAIEEKVKDIHDQLCDVQMALHPLPSLEEEPEEERKLLELIKDELICTDAQLAEALRVNKSTVTRWRTGKLSPPNPERFWNTWEVVGTRWQAKKTKSLGQEVV